MPPPARSRLPAGASGGFSLIELLVVLAIIAVLSALLLPAMRLVRQTAQASVCQGQLRQLFLGALAYANEAEGRLPAVHECGLYPNNVNWDVRVMAYLDAQRVQFCPLRPSTWTWQVGYGMNHNINLKLAPCSLPWGGTTCGYGGPRQLIAIAKPSENLLFADGTTFHLGSPWGMALDYRHGAAGAQAICVDGHTTAMTPQRHQQDFLWGYQP